jgi:hypothetical protein
MYQREQLIFNYTYRKNSGHSYHLIVVRVDKPANLSRNDDGHTL